MYLGTPGLASAPQVNTYPADGLLPGFRFPDILDTYGQDKYVVLTVDCIFAGDDAQGGCSGSADPP